MVQQHSGRDVAVFNMQGSGLKKGYYLCIALTDEEAKAQIAVVPRGPKQIVIQIDPDVILDPPFEDKQK